uniref:Uncharacterized protein n=2 Tax=Parascaris univalens TaxID=6257 RepID=A0A914ZZU4_PARUN
TDTHILKNTNTSSAVVHGFTCWQESHNYSTLQCPVSFFHSCGERFGSKVNMDGSGETGSTKKTSDSQKKETNPSLRNHERRSGSSGSHVAHTNTGSSIKKLRKLISLRKNKLLRSTSPKSAELMPRLEESIIEGAGEVDTTQPNGTKTAPLKKVELLLPVEKAKSFTIGSDEAINTAEQPKYVEHSDLKTAKAKSIRKEIRKPSSGAAIRQIVSQKQAQRSDKLEDDRMLPLCSAQTIMKGKVNARKLQANMRRRARRLKEYSFILTRWYLAFTANKTVALEITMRGSMNAEWKSSGPFKMRRQFSRYFDEHKCEETRTSAVSWTAWSHCQNGHQFRWKSLKPGMYTIDGSLYDVKSC